jgi:hypothetical protein
MVGYSNKSLVEKLGIKPGFQVLILHPPEQYELTLGALPANINDHPASDTPLNFIQFFTKNLSELSQGFPDLKKRLRPDGILWISWPKSTSSLKTDLNESLVREIGLKNGLVDVKIIAIDKDWSGLKFVYRIVDRKG